MNVAWRAAAALLTLAAAGCGPRGARPVQGYVEAEYLYPAAPAAGRLLERPVARGQLVHAGALLGAVDASTEQLQVAQLEDRLAQAGARLADSRKGLRPEELAAVEAQVSQLTAAAELARLEADRRKALIDKGVIAASEWDQARLAGEQTRRQLDEARARLETARLGARIDVIDAAAADWRAVSNQLAEARWRLDQQRVLCLRDAFVQDTFFEPGDWVPAGRPLVALSPPDQLKVRFYLPAPAAAGVKVGTAVRIRTDAGAATPATVSFISDRAEYTPPVIYSRDRREKLVFLMEARLPAQDATHFHPGQPVEIVF